MAPLTGLFASVLESRRESFNARFMGARRELPKLDGAAVLEFLRVSMPPIAEAVHAVAPDELGVVCERLFEVALPLIGKDLLGPNARSPAVVLAWEEILPALPRLLAADPERLARATSNAMFSLESQAGARPEFWATELLALAERAGSVAELLEAGKVLGWRAGLAQYRRSALELAGRLPAPLAARALGLNDESRLAYALERLSADPWADPNRPSQAEPSVQARTGGFRGLGGPFLAPPRVAMADGGLVATDGESTFTLHADRFGAAFLSSMAPFPQQPEAGAGKGLWERLSKALSGSGAGFQADGTLTREGASKRFPELAGASSSAFDGRTWAVTLPLSHHVWLLAPGPA